MPANRTFGDEHTMSHSLDHIMKPSSIAVIGASTKPHTIGSDLMKRLIEFGFKGRIYPVNPKGSKGFRPIRACSTSKAP